MHFATDKQTLNDLNIFGNPGAESLFSLFDTTFTRGGAGIMEQLFLYPLTDAHAINQRSRIIQYFASVQVVFPFQRNQVDAIEEWLTETDERSKLLQERPSAAKKLANLFAADAGYKTISKGVNAMLLLMKGLQQFIDAPAIEVAGPYQKEAEMIRQMMADPAFAAMLREHDKEKLTYDKIATYDVLMRFRQRSTIKKILQQVYFLDVYIAVAGVAKERRFIFPEAVTGSETMSSIEGVYHPQVKNAVRNSIYMDAGSNVIFLTGANMAGKSTIMKSIGLAVFLAHMGFPVPAESMRFAVLDGIFTTINLPDNLGMGASHFYAEVLRVKMIAKELSRQKKLLLIFDELFRGTNVKDAHDATVATTSAFAQRPGSLYIISTHIIEAGEVLRQQYNNIRFLFLPTIMNGQVPVYTYKLETGISADRHGMVIINNEGILAILEKERPRPVKMEIA